MPAAPAPPPSRVLPTTSSPRSPRITSAAWPLAILFALAALSWGAISSLPVSSGPSGGYDTTHLVSSTPADAPRDAVVPSARPTGLTALRLAADALPAGASAVALVAAWGVVVLLDATVPRRDARQRWWARLVGAPPVPDGHLV